MSKYGAACLLLFRTQHFLILQCGRAAVEIYDEVQKIFLIIYMQHY